MSENEFKFNDNGYPTLTSEMQEEVEESVLAVFQTNPPLYLVLSLKRNAHVQYLQNSLQSSLNKWFVSLDASKPWMVYWILHSLTLLDNGLDIEVKTKAIRTLETCIHEDGGFSGGVGQIAHLATTYAAISALAIIGTSEAFSIIDRPKIYAFLMRMKQEDGSFRMHDGGEIDIRGTYCAVNVAVLLNILTPELLINAADYICRCQSFDGGLGPIPGVEAHGGYTFCGLAAMVLMNKVHMLDIDLLAEWIASRQMQLEGGFQGRTNKLVDGCYSFWQGAAAVLLETHLKHTKKQDYIEIFDREALQKYIYFCCQSPKGGLLDKPGKHPDFYHTCYCLSGLSLCKYEFELDARILELKFTERQNICGSGDNRLKPLHPIHNIDIDAVENIKLFYN